MAIHILILENSLFYQTWFKKHLNKLELTITSNNSVTNVTKLYQNISPDIIIISPDIKDRIALNLSRQLLTYDSSISIIILTNDYNPNYVFEALGIGVFDVLNWSEKSYELASKLKRKIELSVQLKYNKKGKNNSASKYIDIEKLFAFSLYNIDIIVIGASTGGPKIIQQILSPLPVNFSIPIVVVQHMPSYWGKFLLNWLKTKVLLPVKLTITGMLPKQGIYLADPSCCWIIDKRGRFKAISNKNARYGVPSIDEFFSSVAEFYSDKAIGILLTGMGDDGALGLKKMKEKGAVTIVQEKTSCTIYGMPQKALSQDNSHLVLDPISIRTILLNLERNQYGRKSYTIS